MTNKELAVQVYTAIIQAGATICSNPNFTGKMQAPTIDSAISEITEIAEKLEELDK